MTTSKFVRLLTVSRCGKFSFVLQVIFYAQLGKEEQSFTFDDVVDNLVQKLVHRHPHVFPEGQLRQNFPQGTTYSNDQLKAQRETIKQEGS
jgi:ATP diphosphatase